VRRLLEDRSEREAERGQRERGGGDPADRLGADGHEPASRNRLALEGAGDHPVGGVLGLLLVLVWHGH
jgi:hypothetical protein